MKAILQDNIPPSFTIQKIEIVNLWLTGIFSCNDFMDMVNCWTSKGRLTN